MGPGTGWSAPIAERETPLTGVVRADVLQERQHGPHERALQRLTGSGQGLVHVMEGKVFWQPEQPDWWHDGMPPDRLRCRILNP